MIGQTLNRHMKRDAILALRRARPRIRNPYVCETCDATDDIHGHHDDYAKPLELRWLCRSCHIRLHMARGEWRPHGQPIVNRPAWPPATLKPTPKARNGKRGRG